MEGLFVVNVIGCRLTRDTEIFGKMDPYCLLQTGDQKAMTSVKIDAGKKCEWNETFTFYVKQDDVLKFQVWDEDPGTDDLVGESFLNVSSSFTEKQSFSFALSYADKGAGEIDLELQFFPQERKKIEEVKKLQNLIREKQMQLEKHLKEEHKDVKIINSLDDSKREEELKRAIEKDKMEIHGLENQFKELFANFDKELCSMNQNLASMIKENNNLKEIITVSTAKLEEFSKNTFFFYLKWWNWLKGKVVSGGCVDILIHKATIVRDVETLGKMDPFVIFHLGKTSAKTNVAKDQGKNPIWNQNLKLERIDEEILRFEVIDYNDLLKSQLIGYGSVCLFNLIHNKTKKSLNTFLYYKGEKIGTLDMEIQFLK